MKRYSDDFERAFVATSYLMDRRGDELVRPIAGGADTAQRLAAALGHPERGTRAVVLAREVARIAQALDARRLS